MTGIGGVGGPEGLRPERPVRPAGVSHEKFVVLPEDTATVGGHQVTGVYTNVNFGAGEVRTVDFQNAFDALWAKENLNGPGNAEHGIRTLAGDVLSNQPKTEDLDWQLAPGTLPGK